MRLYREQDHPVGGNVQVFRASALGPLLGFLFVGAGTTLMAVRLFQGELPAALWLGCGFLALMSLMLLGMARSGFRRGNWVVKFDGIRLAFKFRSHLNRAFSKDDPVVAVFEASEFAGLRKTTESRLVRRHLRSYTTESWVALDFRLKDPNAAVELERAIREEQARKPSAGPLVRMHHQDAPMSVVEDSILCVMWSSTSRRLRPGPDEALRALGGSIRLESELRLGARNYLQMSAEELKNYVTELARSGQRDHALQVLGEVQGMGLVEARAYVDRLVQPTSS